MNGMDRYFRLHENGTSVGTEALAGSTTFLTMAYIIFLQPAILSGLLFGMNTGMDFGAVMVATCVSAAVATAFMGLYANYPIAQAPGMGENFFFVFSVIPAAASMSVVEAGITTAWQVALGVVFVSGVLFLLLSLVGLRALMVDAISPNMKNGIAAGIGLFIALIGMRNATLILPDPATAVKLNVHIASPDILLFFAGLCITAGLQARRVRGAVFWGILVITMLSILARLGLNHAPAFVREHELVTKSMLMTQFEVMHSVVSRPPSVAPTFMKMSVLHALTLKMAPFIVIFLFMDVFDTIGTLVGVCEQAGFVKDNRIPRVRQAMVSDAVGTVIGAGMGTSTVTSFVESTTGVEYGGRTGLTSVVTALLFLLALFFSPVVKMVGSYAAITAPALVIVGAMMIRSAVRIDWKDYSEAIPAFLTLIGIPFCYSIGDGLALGFISYPVIKLLSGRGREVKPTAYVIGVVLIAYFVLVRNV
ncbi:MAG: NCS2 family permease [Kiritimatiellae bacterium]|nr:NCS2 family permease [Kiritimatiellia bacterium]